MAKLFANSGDPDQTPRSAAFDLGLHCLRITLLQVYNGLRVKTEMWFYFRFQKSDLEGSFITLKKRAVFTWISYLLSKSLCL